MSGKRVVIDSSGFYLVVDLGDSSGDQERPEQEPSQNQGSQGEEQRGDENENTSGKGGKGERGDREKGKEDTSGGGGEQEGREDRGKQGGGRPGDGGDREKEGEGGDGESGDSPEGKEGQGGGKEGEREGSDRGDGGKGGSSGGEESGDEGGDGRSSGTGGSDIFSDYDVYPNNSRRGGKDRPQDSQPRGGGDLEREKVGDKGQNPKNPSEAEPPEGEEVEFDPEQIRGKDSGAGEDLDNIDPLSVVRGEGGKRSDEEVKRSGRAVFHVTHGGKDVSVNVFSQYWASKSKPAPSNQRLASVLRTILSPFLRSSSKSALDPSVPLPGFSVSRGPSSHGVNRPRMAFGAVDQVPSLSLDKSIVFVDVSASMSQDLVYSALRSFYRAISDLGFNRIVSITIYHAGDIVIVPYVGKPMAVAEAVASGMSDRAVVSLTGMTNGSEPALTAKIRSVLSHVPNGSLLYGSSIPVFWFSDFLWNTETSPDFSRFLSNKLLLTFVSMARDGDPIDTFMNPSESSDWVASLGLDTLCKIYRQVQYGAIMDGAFRSNRVLLTPGLYDLVGVANASGYTFSKSRCYKSV